MSTEAVRYFIQGDGNLANPERVDNVDISTVDSVTKAVVADAHKATPGVLYMIKFLDGPEWASPASGKPPRSNDSNKIIVRLTKAPNPAQQQGLGGQAPNQNPPPPGGGPNANTDNISWLAVTEQQIKFDFAKAMDDHIKCMRETDILGLRTTQRALMGPYLKAPFPVSTLRSGNSSRLEITCESLYAKLVVDTDRAVTRFKDALVPADNQQHRSPVAVPQVTGAGKTKLVFELLSKHFGMVIRFIGHEGPVFLKDAIARGHQLLEEQLAKTEHNKHYELCAAYHEKVLRCIKLWLFCHLEFALAYISHSEVSKLAPKFQLQWLLRAMNNGIRFQADVLFINQFGIADSSSALELKIQDLLQQVGASVFKHFEGFFCDEFTTLESHCVGFFLHSNHKVVAKLDPVFVTKQKLAELTNGEAPKLWVIPASGTGDTEYKIAESSARPTDASTKLYNRPTSLMYMFLVALEDILVRHAVPFALLTTSFTSWKSLTSRNLTTRGRPEIKRFTNLNVFDWKALKYLMRRMIKWTDCENTMGVPKKCIPKQIKEHLRYFVGRPYPFEEKFIPALMAQMLRSPPNSEEERDKCVTEALLEAKRLTKLWAEAKINAVLKDASKARYLDVILDAIWSSDGCIFSYRATVHTTVADGIALLVIPENTAVQAFTRVVKKVISRRAALAPDAMPNIYVSKRGSESELIRHDLSRGKLNYSRLMECHMKEAVSGAFPMTRNPNDDHYFVVLADRYHTSKDSDVPERLASYVFLRSHTLNAGKSIRESLPRLCNGIPTGILDSYRFAHSTSGTWELFVSSETHEVSLYTRANGLHFPSEYMVYPSQFFKPDLLTGLVGLDSQEASVPFACSVRARGEIMRSSDFANAIQQLNPRYFYYKSNGKKFLECWRNSPTYFTRYVRCVFSASGFHHSVVGCVAEYNRKHGATQPVILMNPCAALCGSEIEGMFAEQPVDEMEIDTAETELALVLPTANDSMQLIAEEQNSEEDVEQETGLVQETKRRKLGE